MHLPGSWGPQLSMQIFRLQTCRQSLAHFKLLHICAVAISPKCPSGLLERPTNAEMKCLLLCCRLAEVTTADMPTSHVLQACSARVLLKPTWAAALFAPWHWAAGILSVGHT